MKQLAFLVLSALAGVSPQAAMAQGGDAQEFLARGLQLAYQGDTTSAVAELSNAVKADPKLADAYYYLGRLYSRRASAVETDFLDRRRAEEALLSAIRLNSDDPRYILELGWLRLKQHMTPDAGRLIGRSLRMAKAGGDPEMLAEIHYSIGYMKDLRYQAVRHRRRSPMFGGPPQSQLDEMLEVRITRYTNQFFGPESAIAGSGSLDKDEMIEHYRAALKYYPGHVGAATRLMGYLYDDYRLSEYYSVARRLLAARPDDRQARLFYALGLHAMGREEEAAVAFDRALEKMSPADREAIENLAPVMRRRDAEIYERLEGAAREKFEDVYWNMKDPLLLTDANERRLEHVARVAYAELRFTEPASGRRGWETDRGIVFIRYGFPQSVGSFSAEMGGDPFTQGKRQIIWSYGKDGPVFQFEQTAGYVHARFSGDYRIIAENYRFILPSKYDDIPSIPEMLTLPVQIARFRGDTPEEVAVEIHAAIPLDSLARGLDMEKGEIQTGVFILNKDGEKIVERRNEEVLTYADGATVNELRTWRVIMPPEDGLLAAVEARDPLTWRTAVSRDTFSAVSFSGDTLQVSDILVAEVLRPLIDEPRRRQDFDIIANPSLEFRSGESIHIYYELYGFGTDSEGFASYDVALAVRVKELDRGGGVAQLLGGLADAWGFSMVGDDRLELRFHREIKTDGRDRVTEYLTLDPNEVPAGEYEIRLRIWDRLGEHLVSRSRSFFVTSSKE